MIHGQRHTLSYIFSDKTFFNRCKLRKKLVSNLRVKSLYGCNAFKDTFLNLSSEPSNASDGGHLYIRWAIKCFLKDPLPPLQSHLSVVWETLNPDCRNVVRCRKLEMRSPWPLVCTWTKCSSLTHHFSVFISGAARTNFLITVQEEVLSEILQEFPPTPCHLKLYLRAKIWCPNWNPHAFKRCPCF